MSNPSSKELNPRTKEYEFGGPLGALAISVGLPALIQLFFLGCNKDGCPNFNIKLQPFLTKQVFGVYMLWMISLIVLDYVVPGQHVSGTKLRTGEHLKYKFNGTNVIIILASLLAFRAWSTNLELPELQFIYNNCYQLSNATLVTAVVLSTVLYIASFGRDKLLALGGNTGNPIYDWFIGRELNPRWGFLDVKLFLEMRPGLLLWILIDLAMLHHQYSEYGHVSNSILLVTLFQTYYVVEGTFYESGLVSMIDTTTDGLGFMLVFGDITLVPFTYSLQTRFLADRPRDWSWPVVAFICSVYLLGIFIFRSANNQKNKFRAGDPSTNHLKYIDSPTGSKLLITGWWGMARHINYTGDWISSWAYSLPCGFNIIPYYFVLFFATLLIHRNGRDEAKCAAKYGDVWTKYKQLVPYKFIPYVY